MTILLFHEGESSTVFNWRNQGKDRQHLTVDLLRLCKISVTGHSNNLITVAFSDPRQRQSKTEEYVCIHWKWRLLATHTSNSLRSCLCLYQLKKLDALLEPDIWK